MERIYLDYAATTPAHPRVVEAMHPYFSDKFGNPSSIHSFGQEARAATEKAREQVARLIGARSGEIVFTSGGTEADNFALEGIAFANLERGNHIIASAIEHHAITECCEFLSKRGFDITYLPVEKDGIVDPTNLEKALTDKTIMVSIMHANNELGTIQPIAEIAKIIRRRNERQKTYFHTDAVQTVGHIPLDVNELGIDLLSMSAHKLYGPKGVGALYVRKGTRMVSFLHGGSQESNRRASTENVAGIVGFGCAAEIALHDLKDEGIKLTRLRDQLIRGILDNIPDSQLNGSLTSRLPNNVNVSIKYVEGESMLLNLDMQGIAASSGSACTSGSVEPSHVLLSIGLSPEVAHGSLRFSLGRFTTEKEIKYVLDILPGIVDKLRKMSPLVVIRN